MPTRGDPRDSATEKNSLWLWLEGNGETVVKRPPASQATRRLGKPTRSKVKRADAGNGAQMRERSRAARPMLAVDRTRPSATTALDR